MYEYDEYGIILEADYERTTAYNTNLVILYEHMIKWLYLMSNGGRKDSSWSESIFRSSINMAFVYLDKSVYNKQVSPDSMIRAYNKAYRKVTEKSSGYYRDHLMSIPKSIPDQFMNFDLLYMDDVLYDFLDIGVDSDILLAGYKKYNDIRSRMRNKSKAGYRNLYVGRCI